MCIYMNIHLCNFKPVCLKEAWEHSAFLFTSYRSAVNRTDIPPGALCLSHNARVIPYTYDLGERTIPLFLIIFLVNVKSKTNLSLSL